MRCSSKGALAKGLKHDVSFESLTVSYSQRLTLQGSLSGSVCQSSTVAAQGGPVQGRSSWQCRVLYYIYIYIYIYIRLYIYSIIYYIRLYIKLYIVYDKESFVKMH